MQITFHGATLADDAASPRLAGVIEQLGGSAEVQLDELYAQPNKFLASLGNVSGQFVFTVFCAYASYADAASALVAAYALIAVQDDVALIYGGTTITMAQSVLRDCQRVEWDGVGLKLRYLFDFTTLTV